MGLKQISVKKIVKRTFFGAVILGASSFSVQAGDVYDFGDRVPTLNELRSVLGTQRKITIDETGASKASNRPAKGQYGAVSFRIQFDLNSARITSSSKEQIAAMGDYLREETTLSVNVVGHADASGGERQNYRLSQDRAQAVRDALVYDYGIKENRLVARGMGEEKPAYDNPYDPRNRRVEFEILN